MRKWDAGEEAMKEPGDVNELIATSEPSEITGGHRRSTDNQQMNPRAENAEVNFWILHDSTILIYPVYGEFNKQ